MAFNFTEYNNDYKKNHYDRVQILIKKGSKEKLDELAKTQGKANLSRLIKDALYAYMDSIGADKIELE